MFAQIHLVKTCLLLLLCESVRSLYDNCMRFYLLGGVTIGVERLIWILVITRC